MKRCFFTILLLVFAAAALAAPQRLAVNVPTANIRSGPGENYAVIWQVGKYHPFLVIEKSGQWIRFRDFEKDEGWIHQSLLADIPTVITIKEKCNIRSGPGTGNPVAFTAEKGVPFKVLEKKDNWIHIEHADGDKGWIYHSLVW